MRLRRVTVSVAAVMLLWAWSALAQQKFYNRSGQVISNSSSLTVGQVGRVVDGNFAAFTTPADDVLMVGNGTTWQDKGVPDCIDSGGNHLNYRQSDNTFLCGTTGGTGGGGAPTGAQYLTLALDGTLTAERRLVVDAALGGLTLTDGGANADATLAWKPETRINNVSLFDGTAASKSLTFDVVGIGTDPILTATASTLNLTAATLQVNSVNVALESRSISTTSPLSGGGNLSANRTLSLTTVPLNLGGTNQTTWTASRCVQVNAGGTALESAAAACGSGGGGGVITGLNADSTGPSTTATVKLAGGTAMDTTFTSLPDTITFDWDSTEVNSTNWGDNSQATNTWTFQTSGANDPQLVFTNAKISIPNADLDVGAGRLTQGVSTSGTGGTNGGLFAVNSSATSGTGIYTGVNSTSVSSNASGTQGTLIGTHSEVFTGSGGQPGAVTTARALDALASKGNTGAVGTLQGLYVKIANSGASGAVTNGYGVYIDDSAPGAGGITNDYALYTAGAERSSFGGNLELRGGSGTVTLSAGASPTITYTMPSGAPAVTGYVLTSTTGGQLSWAVNGGGISTLNTDSGSATGGTVTLQGGSGISTSGTGATVGIDFAANELANITWSDGFAATRTWTMDLSGTDPVITFGSASIDVTTGTLKQGGTAVSLTGHTHSAADITSGILALARGGTNQGTWSGTAGQCVRVNAGGTALEGAGAACGVGGGITTLVADDAGTATGATVTVAGGTGIDTSATGSTLAIAFQPNEINSPNWGNNTAATQTWTFQASGSPDPVLSFSAASVALTNAALTLTAPTSSTVPLVVNAAASQSVPLLKLVGAASGQPNMQWMNSDTYASMEAYGIGHDNNRLSFDAYFTNPTWKSASINSNFQLYKSSTDLVLQGDWGIAQGSTLTWENIWRATSGLFVINADLADRDLQVAGTVDSVLLYADAGNNRVGVGTSVPGAKLDVAFTATAAGTHWGVNSTVANNASSGSLTLNALRGYATTASVAIGASTLRGLESVAQCETTNGCSTVIGVEARAVKNNGSGTVAGAYGGYFAVANNTGPGQITNGYGVYVALPGTASTIATYVPLYTEGNYKSSFGGPVELRGSGGTNNVILSAGATPANITYTMPTTAPTAGQILSSAVGGQLSWVAPGVGSGDVVGPASATDTAIVRFNGTTGKLVQNSGATIDANNQLSTVLTTTSASNFTMLKGQMNVNVTTAGNDYIGTQGLIIGVNSSGTNGSLWGTWGQADSAFASNGAVTTVAGLRGLGRKTGSGNVNSAYGAVVGVQNTVLGGTLSTAAGLYVEAAVNSGTITNLYGIYAAGAEMNRFQGPIGIRTDPGGGAAVYAYHPTQLAFIRIEAGGASQKAMLGLKTVNEEWLVWNDETDSNKFKLDSDSGTVFKVTPGGTVNIIDPAFADRYLAFEVYSGDGNMYINDVSTSGTVTPHLILRTLATSGTNQGDIVFMPRNVEQGRFATSGLTLANSLNMTNGQFSQNYSSSAVGGSVAGQLNMGCNATSGTGQYTGFLMAAYTQNTTGTQGTIVGGQGDAQVVSAGGTTTARGLMGTVGKSAGTLTTAQAGYFKVTLSGANTVTNAYGVYIDDSAVSGVGGVTNEYALYTAGTEPSSFGGDVDLRGGKYSGGFSTPAVSATAIGVAFTLTDAATSGSAFYYGADFLSTTTAAAEASGSTLEGARLVADCATSDGCATVYGTLAAAKKSGTGVVATATAGIFQLQNNNATGAITTGTGVAIADAINTGGGFTTQIGLDVGQQTKGTTNIGIRNAGTTVFTPNTQAIAAASNTITCDVTYKKLTTITGTTNFTSNPTIADGQTGQVCIIENVDATATDCVGFVDNLGIQLVGNVTVTLCPNDIIAFVFDGTDWIELFTANN